MFKFTAKKKSQETLILQAIPAFLEAEKEGFEPSRHSENIDFIRVQSIVQTAVFKSVFRILLLIDFIDQIIIQGITYKSFVALQQIYAGKDIIF